MKSKREGGGASEGEREAGAVAGLLSCAVLVARSGRAGKIQVLPQSQVAGATPGRCGACGTGVYYPM